MKISASLVLLLLGLGLTACEDRKIKTYTTPKETTQPLLTAAPSTARPHWTKPDGWKELPPSGMRAASFAAADPVKNPVDISVVTFPGEAGGLLANLNRWRGQMKLAPAPDAAGLETLDAVGQPVQIVELTSTEGDNAMLGAIFLRADQSWFVKLTGTKAAIDEQRARFRAFALSFRFDAAPTRNPSTNDG